MLPIPFIDFIPKIYKDNAKDSTTAMTDKVDTHLNEWLTDIIELAFLKDPFKIPSLYLEQLGNFLNAGLLTQDTEAQKRNKIATAIQAHKRRGTFAFDAKPKIDAIALNDSQIFRSADADDWILVGDGLTPATHYWAALGVDGIDDSLGISLIGEGTEVEIAGNIYIDVDNDSLTQDEVDQIVLELSEDIVPAYYIVNIGYLDGTGAFVIYSGGIIQ